MNPWIAFLCLMAGLALGLWLGPVDLPQFGGGSGAF
jgi:hypothetical protein